MNTELVPSAPPTLSIVNIAAYRFAQLGALPALRAELLALCRANQLRGTILLSAEGINLFIAGESTGVEALLTRLRLIPGLGQLEAKYSQTAHQPFRRMLVRLKREFARRPGGRGAQRVDGVRGIEDGIHQESGSRVGFPSTSRSRLSGFAFCRATGRRASGKL